MNRAKYANETKTAPNATKKALNRAWVTASNPANSRAIVGILAFKKIVAPFIPFSK